MEKIFEKTIKWYWQFGSYTVAIIRAYTTEQNSFLNTKLVRAQGEVQVSVIVHIQSKDHSMYAIEGGVQHHYTSKILSLYYTGNINILVSCTGNITVL